MTKHEINETQRKVGTAVDGFWGEEAIEACKRHLRSLMPNPNPWPDQSQAALTAFYGPPGDESRLTTISVAGLGIKYGGTPVRSIRCHKKVGDSLLRVLKSLAPTHPQILALYAGCYNNRPMRGGSLPSLHARGAAIDLWPERNGNRVSWPVNAGMPIEVMEAFAREGWLAAGAFWGRDAMHFQATS